MIPVGAFRFRNTIADAVAGAALSRLAADMFTALIAEFQMLDTRIADLDCKLVDIQRTNEQSRRLVTLLGVGPVVATALVAAIDDRRNFCIVSGAGSMDRSCAKTIYYWR